MQPEHLTELLEAAMPEANVIVRSEDGIHFQAVIVTPAFAGLGRVRRHQLVYAALGSAMDEDIHALTLRTMTPHEWSEQQS